MKSQLLPLFLLGLAWALLIGGAVWLTLRLVTRHPKWPLRRALATLGFVLWLAWVFVGTSLWIGRKKVPVAVRLASFPVIVTTWPAHQASLVLAGHGLGANVPPQPTVGGLAALALWCLVLWAPLIGLRLKKIPLAPALILQLAMILVVCFTFASFGNG